MCVCVCVCVCVREREKAQGLASEGIQTAIDTMHNNDALYYS